MGTRRVSAVWLTAIFITGVGVGWRQFAAGLATPGPAMPPVGAPGAISLAVPHGNAAAGARVGRFPRAAGLVRSTPAELPADAAALTVEAAELQLLAQGSGLTLDPQQWAALAAVTLDIQAVRLAYEATIATCTVLGPGRYRAEIPVYAAAGDALRARFQAELNDQLGAGAAAEILAQMGARLEGRFGGFGVSVQTLDIAGDPWAASSDWVLTRTAKFWNSVEGENRLTTRCETFMPGREDPSGDHWGPLLSVLSQRVTAEAGS